MLTKLKAYSPFYAAYAPQSEAINSAVAIAAAQSAAKMGKEFAKVYSILESQEKLKLAA